MLRSFFLFPPFCHVCICDRAACQRLCVLFKGGRGVQMQGSSLPSGSGVWQSVCHRSHFIVAFFFRIMIQRRRLHSFCPLRLWSVCPRRAVSHPHATPSLFHGSRGRWWSDDRFATELNPSQADVHTCPIAMWKSHSRRKRFHTPPLQFTRDPLSGLWRPLPRIDRHANTHTNASTHTSCSYTFRLSWAPPIRSASGQRGKFRRKRGGERGGKMKQKALEYCQDTHTHTRTYVKTWAVNFLFSTRTHSVLWICFVLSETKQAPEKSQKNYQSAFTAEPRYELFPETLWVFQTQIFSLDGPKGKCTV